MTTDRKAIAAAFRAAKPLLWDGRGSQKTAEEFICIALLVSRHPSARLAEEIVASRIRPYTTLSTWLSETHGIRWIRFPSRGLQAHRHAWLDMLIAEFEGDEK
jgi:hypothetical protein